MWSDNQLHELHGYLVSVTLKVAIKVARPPQQCRVSIPAQIHLCGEEGGRIVSLLPVWHMAAPFFLLYRPSSCGWRLLGGMQLGT